MQLEDEGEVSFFIFACHSSGERRGAMTLPKSASGYALRPSPYGNSEYYRSRDNTEAGSLVNRKYIDSEAVWYLILVNTSIKGRI